MGLLGAPLRGLGRHPLVVDSLLAAALVPLGLAVDRNDLERPYGLFAGLVLAQTLPVAARRRWPLAALAVTAGALFAHVALGLPSTAAALGPGAAVYAAATRGRRPLGAWVAAVATLAALASPFVDDGNITAGEFFAYLALFTLPWLVGSRIRRTREYTAELEERAARAERERAAEAERAVVEERARLARELHDVVSHAVSVTVVQAGAAARVLRTQPERAAEHVAAIESAGREAMAELRRLLGVLRENGAAGEPLAPQPGVDDLPALAERMRAAGLPVELAVEGVPRPLPASLEGSLYRIVQEALTNVLRHAGPARARVRLRYGPAAIELAVSDDGRGAPADPARGQGLLGMHERVAVFGGELHAGNRPEGGFEVSVSLPLDPPAT